MSNTTISSSSVFSSSPTTSFTSDTSTFSTPQTSSIPTTTSSTPTSSSASLFTTSSSSPTTSSPTSTSSPRTSTTPTSATSSTESLATFTSRVTVSPTSGGGTPSVVTVTSTENPTGTSAANSAASASSASRASAAASSSSRAAALATSGADSSSGSKGLSDGGKIAIAVVVPIAAIAAIVVALLFFWKRRKARRTAEEERRQEVEEYGYNPNNDPTLPVVGSTYGETQSEMTEDNSGYRGWGATSAQRKPSTTLGSSNRGAVGMATSDTTSNPGGLNGQNSEGNSGEPLVSSPTRERPFTGDSETIGALGAAGAAPVAGTQQRDINRGPSNASSSYTGGHAQSEASEDGDRSPQGVFAPQESYGDATYYNEAQANHGPYGDGTYGGGQPVIRDVQARRNTRIEKPSVFPQQGNAGISQNF